MRKIEQKLLDAIRNNQPMHCGNTMYVLQTSEPGVGLVALHGHNIAKIDTKTCRPIAFRLAGWNTPTTRSRLNAVATLGAPRVCTRKGVPYCGTFQMPASDWHQLDEPKVQAYRTDFDWSRECDYISKTTDDALHGSASFKSAALASFNGDLACFQRYCEMQRDCATRDGKHDAAEYIVHCLDDIAARLAA